MSYRFSDLRVRTRVHPDEMKAMVGKVLYPEAIDVQLVGPTILYAPDGRLVAKYLPRALSTDLLDEVYGTLHELRSHETENRQLAAGSGPSVPDFAGSTRMRSAPVSSAIIGSFDANPPKLYCRLTAWSGKEIDKFQSLFPLFRAIGAAFAEYVPDRYAAQMDYINRTHPDWVIRGTPFTTATINNSFPTGVHTDSGDLEEGFSNLAVLRRGDYSGGIFCFPEYRVGVDMQHGDVLLMDAHAWHGNTWMTCSICGQGVGSLDYYPRHDVTCGVERISCVMYYRRKMAACGSAEDEVRKAEAWSQRRVDLHDRTLTEMAEESAQNVPQTPLQPVREGV